GRKIQDRRSALPAPGSGAVGSHPPAPENSFEPRARPRALERTASDLSSAGAAALGGKPAPAARARERSFLRRSAPPDHPAAPARRRALRRPRRPRRRLRRALANSARSARRAGRCRGRLDALGEGHFSRRASERTADLLVLLRTFQ